MCDRKGAIYQGREGLNWIKTEMAEVTNLSRKTGDACRRAGAARTCSSASPRPDTVTTEMVKTMNKDAIIFACANPTPEIFPDAAKAGGARVVSTGRSDYPNQINNVLAFPGIFRGAFDVRASDINEEMKVAAAEALAGLVGDEELPRGLYHPRGVRSARRPRGGRRRSPKPRAGAAWQGFESDRRHEKTLPPIVPETDRHGAFDREGC